MALINSVSRAVPTPGDATLRQVALTEFVSSFPLAPYAEFYTFSGNSDELPGDAGDVGAGKTRTPSTGYTPVETPPTFKPVSLKIYGDLLQTDKAWERRGQQLDRQILYDLRKFAQGLGRYFMNAVVNHDTGADSEQLMGWKALIAAGDGTETAWGSNGTVLDATNLQAFMELLEEEIQQVPGGPTCIVANHKFIARLGNLAREYVRVERGPNVFGQEQRLTSIQGIPLVNAGYGADGNALVIPNNETQGTNNDTTSVYLIRFGERMDVTFATSTGLDVQALGMVGTKFQTLVEFDVNQVVLNAKSLRRIKGIRF
ncbi:MAG: hypothetical protein KatS3mg051_1578 [Anaerolineae bacterium]|nr:MAG: hypothetical protein KatS3mg051_1578 [Anaerolineae bacterium]